MPKWYSFLGGVVYYVKICYLCGVMSKGIFYKINSEL